MKTKRHAKILELISEREIDTQEELLKALKTSGFDVTQATVSRDIKELRLIKTLSYNGNYKYAASTNDQGVDMASKFYSIFKESAYSVDYAGNLVVVKCYVGMANAACAALDIMHLPGVVGTLAGDDTILIVMRDEAGTMHMIEELKKIIDK
ncbi:arginine repressor [Candidatus Soleaferrea massiliensis]|uniref:arginine repressor n=1 Tax=Candidatus Soleaferrea massiliensis TaxID=1470354 RepID=UPI00058B9FE3|nr:arginine repressor [Candidatus Soleaferrea massiliensis]